MLIRLFGPEAPGVVLDAAMSRGRGLRRTGVLTPDPGLAGTLSSLARLHAVRGDQPRFPPGSPWWAGGKAVELPLSAPGGLQPRGQRPRRGRGSPSRRRLRSLTWPPRWKISRRTKRARPACSGRSAPVPCGKVPSSSDCRHTPISLSRHEGSQGQLAIEALLAPGADYGVLSAYQVRVTDPKIRRILAQASFAVVGSRARAELQPSFPLDEVPESWIEVVRHSKCPAGSLSEHRDRRARRWADAALRAERIPAGLDPEATPADWSALAVAAWELCSFDWAAAGDADRAYLAAQSGVPPSLGA